MERNIPQMLENLVCDFLAIFSRFEQALKVADFHYGEGVARANWIKFGENDQVEAELSDPESSVADAVDLLLNNPPKKQIIREGNLAWENTPASQNTDSKRALVYLKRVRNNLFHGGKFAEGGYLRKRDIDLIRASKQILLRCTELETGVGERFHYMENAV